LPRTARNQDQRTPLTRDRVLRAALRLADQAGLEGLTMRRLGDALGVEAMSLYNHVANKDDVLDGIVGLVLAEVELPDGKEEWDVALRLCAVSAHDALMRHPWACRLVIWPGAGSAHRARTRYMEWALDWLTLAGFSSELVYHGYHALDSHVLGFSLWQTAHTGTSGDLAEAFLRAPTAAQYPYLAQHEQQHVARSSDDGEFEFGLDLILEGLKRAKSAPDGRTAGPRTSTGQAGRRLAAGPNSSKE
jgi:AcrR family transcriptional regulator